MVIRIARLLWNKDRQFPSCHRRQPTILPIMLPIPYQQGILLIGAGIKIGYTKFLRCISYNNSFSSGSFYWPPTKTATAAISPHMLRATLKKQTKLSQPLHKHIAYHSNIEYLKAENCIIMEDLNAHYTKYHSLLPNDARGSSLADCQSEFGTLIIRDSHYSQLLKLLTYIPISLNEEFVVK